MPSIAVSTALTRRSLLAGGAALTAMPLWAQGPVRIERMSPALDRWIAPGTPVETIATDIRWAEGPVWVPRERALFFSDPPANIMRRWRAGEGAQTFLTPSGAAGTDPRLVREPGSNGLALAHDGALLIANSGGRSIDRLDLTTKRRSVLVGRHDGKRFNSPNDLTVARGGAIYFTDPPYGLTDGDTSPAKELPYNGVYRWAPGMREATLVDGTLTRPNGIALSPDERRLYVSVSDEKAPRIVAYDLDARGMPTGSRILVDAGGWKGPGLPDGMKVAGDGTLFCSAPGGYYLLTPAGEPIGRIANGGPIANCCFGEGGRTLFLTANHAVLRVALRRDAFARS